MRLKDLQNELRRLLKETPSAAYGNMLAPADYFHADITAQFFREKWNIIGEIKLADNILIVGHMFDNGDDIYVAGYFDEKLEDFGSYKETKEVFFVLLQAYLKKDNYVEQHFPYKNVYSIAAIKVSTAAQTRGIATAFYQWILNQGIILRSDQLQYNGARRLWAKLSNFDHLVVDVLDIKNNTIVAKNEQLYHGFKEDDFDKRYWSRNDDKKDIVFILTKVV
jgi:hypothetical protein